MTSSVSREFKIELIGIKITSLGAILGQVIITFDQNSVQAPLHASIADPDLAWQREDALTDFVRVLDNMEIRDKMSDSNVLAQFEVIRNLSQAMHVLQLRQEAYKLTLIWHKVIRRLARANPDKYQSSLAGSLLVLSLQQTPMGRREEALNTSQEAVKIFKELAEKNPDTFDSSLSASLHEMSLCLLNMGEREKALGAIEQAVEIRRRLVSKNPARE